MKIIRMKNYYGVYEEIEVTDEFYEQWLELHREEDRLRKREIYHRNWATEDEVAQMVQCAVPDILTLLVEAEETARLDQALKEALEQLTPTQKRRVLQLAQNLSVSEIARREGKRQSSVDESVRAALKKMRRFIEDAIS